MQGEGDEAAGVEPGDIVIELQENENELFKRKNADLVPSCRRGLAEGVVV